MYGLVTFSRTHRKVRLLGESCDVRHSLGRKPSILHILLGTLARRRMVHFGCDFHATVVAEVKHKECVSMEHEEWLTCQDGPSDRLKGPLIALLRNAVRGLLLSRLMPCSIFPASQVMSKSWLLGLLLGCLAPQGVVRPWLLAMRHSSPLLLAGVVQAPSNDLRATSSAFAGVVTTSRGDDPPPVWSSSSDVPSQHESCEDHPVIFL